jgi:glucan phosphoethanolaminetransferase (alkaline phosphatase superfamily)
MISQATAVQSKTNQALVAIGVAGLVGATLDLMQACILFGHDIILVITCGLIGDRALKGGAGNYALGILLHVFIALCFATVYYLASRRLPFLTEYPLVCGITFGAAVHLFMMLVVLPLSALHQTDPLTVGGLIKGLLIHMVVFGLPVAYGISRLAPAEYRPSMAGKLEAARL